MTSRVRLPKIKSMTMNTSYKFLKRGSHDATTMPGSTNAPFQGQNTGSDLSITKALKETYDMAKLLQLDKQQSSMKDATFKSIGKNNMTIKEVSGENFYDDSFYPQRGNAELEKLNSADMNHPIVQYTIEEGAKCVCFCSQGLGRQQKC